MPRILIVEDDFAISELVMMNLSIAGYECDAAYDGAEALKAIEQQEYDLALLDVMLPERDGFELMSYMQIHAIPVIYVSAKADVTDRIKGLRLGAEDYITKPFDIVELQLRVEKVLSRGHHHPKAYTVAGVLIDEEKRTASNNNQYIDLTPKEFMLMMTLVKHPGVAFSREQLLRDVWGDEFFGETRTVDVHIAALRKKLHWQDVIQTVQSFGYRLRVNP